jgi:hypothetical protein
MWSSTRGQFRSSVGIERADDEKDGADAERDGTDAEVESEESGRVSWLGEKRYGPEMRPFSVASTISSEGAVTGEYNIDARSISGGHIHVRQLTSVWI